VPTRGAVPVLGTNPIAFAAPARRNAPFLSTWRPPPSPTQDQGVRAERKPLPPGWLLDERGQPVTDPKAALQIIMTEGRGGQTPVGGTAEMSSHKGYGLALMAHILGGTLSGASFSPFESGHRGRAIPTARPLLPRIDPKAFRPRARSRTISTR